MPAAFVCLNYPLVRSTGGLKGASLSATWPLLPLPLSAPPNLSENLRATQVAQLYLVSSKSTALHLRS